jgi:hypothetical protein
MKLLGIINMHFDVNISTTDHIFYIRHILEKNWYSKSIVHKYSESL